MRNTQVIGLQRRDFERLAEVADKKKFRSKQELIRFWIHQENERIKEQEIKERELSIKEQEIAHRTSSKKSQP